MNPSDLLGFPPPTLELEDYTTIFSFLWHLALYVGLGEIKLRFSCLSNSYFIICVDILKKRNQSVALLNLHKRGCELLACHQLAFI